MASGTSSSSSSRATPVADEVTLYSDYPDVTEEALRGFEQIQTNEYVGSLVDSYPAADEVMSCDCVQHVVDGVNVACGEDAGCINREMNIECVHGQCGCGAGCRNERFQRNEVADVSIFQTAEKGYGMRADSFLPAGTFIVEYKGEIVDDFEYKLRKERYADEGIKHFYFMKLQDDGMIDATKKASIGRFLNHSCDPNAEIEKWVVNKRYRMGIFAKRDIRSGEEICFNYNVDRYGSEPQKCYCGAKNCVGFLGGKTQTATILQSAARDALGIKVAEEKRYLKEKKKKKGNAKIVKSEIDQHIGDFVNWLVLSPLSIKEIQKVSAYLLQPDSNVDVIERVLERFNTEDEEYPELLDRFHRLHGLQALSSSIKRIAAGKETLTPREKSALAKAVDLLYSWPALKTKTTVQNCNLEDQLQTIGALLKDKKVTQKVNDILDKWKDLQVVYRIPKREGTQGGSFMLDDRRSRQAATSEPAAATADAAAAAAAAEAPASIAALVNAAAAVTAAVNGKSDGNAANGSSKPWGNLNVDELPEDAKFEGEPLPTGWRWNKDPSSGRSYFYNRTENITQWEKPEWPKSVPGTAPMSVQGSASAESDSASAAAILANVDAENKHKKRTDSEALRRKQWEKERELEEKARAQEIAERAETLSSIIQQASHAAVEKEAKAAAAAKKAKSAHRHSSSRGHAHAREHSHSKERPKHSKAEKEWMVVFALAVPNMLKKYESEIGHDNLKNCARDITHILAQKELQRHSESKPPSKLSEDRKKKVHSFVKSYMDKFVDKFEAKKRKKHSEDGERDDSSGSKRSKL